MASHLPSASSSSTASIEIDQKTQGLARRMADLHLDAVLLETPPNFAWITAGASNAIDLTGETGVGAVLVARDGRRWLLANQIEMPRFLEEDGLEGRGFTPADFPWTAEPGDPGWRTTQVWKLLGAGARLGLDRVPHPALGPVQGVGPEIARLRARLTPPEVERYRALGRDAGEALGEVCRGLRPGLSEDEIAGRLAAALLARGAVPVVLLVGSDARLERFRHPLPTAQSWERAVMVVACARRGGLIAALTRIVWAGPVPEEVRRRTRAAAEVNARLLAATRPGVTGDELFAVAARAYEELGFPGEEKRHHQGGPCGYQSRDWIAGPGSAETVVSPQAFAWNPSITGTKVEETWIVGEEGAERITGTAGWPVLEVESGGRTYPIPDVVSLGNL
ncbi:MAG TPA: M24 family metallopeptidase [Thermoanaerobaculia bacterium]|nr:M24 family metallopeptidase [Thermoanaerobaculia bacterium]